MADVDSQGLFWLYQAPNLALAALMYTLLGRFLLSLVFPDDSEKVIWRTFRQITQPVIEAVQAELEPIRRRAEDHLRNPDLVRTIVSEGCEEAREVARATLDEVRSVMGLQYR